MLQIGKDWYSCIRQVSCHTCSASVYGSFTQAVARLLFLKKYKELSVSLLTLHKLHLLRIKILAHRTFTVTNKHIITV